MSSARINPDTRPVVLATTGLIAFLGLVSFAVSFAGLSAVAEWAALPGYLRWAVPVFVDGALLAYTLAVLVQRARDESARFSWFALGSFTVVSVAANAAHVVGVRDTSDWRTYAGAAIASLAPLGVFAATHTLASLAIARPAAVPPRPAEQAPPLDPGTELGQDVGHEADLEPEALSVHDLVPPAQMARILRDSERMSVREIADRMEVSKSTVSRWLTRDEEVLTN
jgi:hypothetical protein